MAINFIPPAVQKYIGTPYGVPIGLCTPLKSAPAVVPLTIDWSLYQAASNNPVAIEVDLTANKNPVNSLDTIRSIYIDNSFSFTPIYVIFPDTGFTVICPANSIVMSPVFNNLNQKIIVYANAFIDGQIPVTDIQLSNVPQNGYVIGTGTFTPPVSAPSVVFLEGADLVGGGVTQTYPSQNIGSAATTRFIILVTYGTAGVGITASGVTLGGNAMSLLTRKSVSSGSGRFADLAVWGLAVAAGTSLVPVVTYNTAPDINAIDIFAAYNLTNNAPSHTSNAQGPNPSAPLTTDAAGIALGLVLDGTNKPASPTGIQNVSSSVYSSQLAVSRGYQQTGGAVLPLAYVTGASNVALVGIAFK